MFRIVLVNIGFIAVAAIPIFIPPLLPDMLSLAVLSVGVLLCFVYLAASAQCFKSVSNYAAFGFADFFACFKEKSTWVSGLLTGGAVLFATLVVSVVIPFYSEIDSPVGIVLAVVVFWILIVCITSFQFFLSFRSRMGNPVLKTIKKCFIVFFDNTAFCIACLVYAIILAVLSVILVFLAPGPAGIVLFLDEALRLRLLKYDWLEENPDSQPSTKRRKIPWDAILIDERENTGSRSLKSFIFPWKD
jgi:hypothetical protein